MDNLTLKLPPHICLKKIHLGPRTDLWTFQDYSPEWTTKSAKCPVSRRLKCVSFSWCSVPASGTYFSGSVCIASSGGGEAGKLHTDSQSTSGGHVDSCAIEGCYCRH
jgi:hypothetical protein